METEDKNAHLSWAMLLAVPALSRFPCGPGGTGRLCHSSGPWGWLSPGSPKKQAGGWHGRDRTGLTSLRARPNLGTRRSSVSWAEVTLCWKRVLQNKLLASHIMQESPGSPEHACPDGNRNRCSRIGEKQGLQKY